MFSEAVKTLGFAKRECVFVDDNWDKILNAFNYGLPGILFPSEEPWGATYLRAVFERMKLL